MPISGKFSDCCKQCIYLISSSEEAQCEQPRFKSKKYFRKVPSNWTSQRYRYQAVRKQSAGRSAWPIHGQGFEPVSVGNVGALPATLIPCIPQYCNIPSGVLNPGGATAPRVMHAKKRSPTMLLGQGVEPGSVREWWSPGATDARSPQHCKVMSYER